MTDPRVTHLWDAEGMTGFWFAQNVEETEGFVWDAYLLYGADATWDRVPTPLIDWGATVISQRANLEANILPLFK